MKEIEVKILDINIEETITKLNKLGAKKIFDGILYAVYFDDKDETLKKNKKILRLRKEGNIAVLTRKTIISKERAKIAEEEEEEVDFDQTYLQLISQGYIPNFVLQKHRQTYKLNDSKIEIDTYQGAHSFVPTFLEIESPDLNKLEEIVIKLGYDKKHALPWSSKEVIKHYMQKQRKK